MVKSLEISQGGVNEQSMNGVLSVTVTCRFLKILLIFLTKEQSLFIRIPPSDNTFYVVHFFPNGTCLFW